MPTSWGQGRTALLLGADGGALDGIVETIRAVGFHVVRAPLGAQLDSLATPAKPLAVVYVDAETHAKALAVLAELRSARPELPVIFVRTSPSPIDVTDAVRAGAMDFLGVGAPATTVIARLNDVLTPSRDRADVAHSQTGQLAGLVGSSPSMLRLVSTITRVARYKTSVLVLGESGVGKELVARAIHLAGPRKSKPFVPVNCATLGKDLLENELFGHERGAFTGATRQKKGLLELADTGTIFLDEIGEMDSATQAKLLRVLEQSELRRVGGTAKIKIDVNVVAATNQDLRTTIASGRFREDLYYRLRVVTLLVPPLREHREDIPALVETFIADFNRRHGGKIRGVSPEAMRLLTEHSWPGNVRELKNVIDSASMLADADLLTDVLLDEALGVSTSSAPQRPSSPRASRSIPNLSSTASDIRFSLPVRLADVERAVILKTVKRSASRARAAQDLGIGLRTLYAKLNEYDADDR